MQSNINYNVSNYLIKLHTYNIYTSHQPHELEKQLVSVPSGGFSLCGKIGSPLSDKVSLCSCMRVQDYFYYKVFYN